MERDFISLRTKAALQSAKARGVKLGGERGSLAARVAGKTLVADQAAAKVAGVIGPMRAANMSLAAIAGELNRMGHSGPQGGRWTPTAVSRALRRAAA
jgi:DNA invertase Pin-like site-specific DNA recombinase